MRCQFGETGCLFGETGCYYFHTGCEMRWIPPFKALIKFNILKFWHRVVSMHADRLTLQICYNTWSKSLSNSGVINWAERTSNILNSLYECKLLHQG